MFQTTLTNFILVYPLFVLVAIGLLWVFVDWRRRSRERHRLERVLRCRICGEAFEITEAVELPRCPHCNSLNERERMRSI